MWQAARWALVTQICFLQVSNLEMAEGQLQLFYGQFPCNSGARGNVHLYFHFINSLLLHGLRTLMVPLILPSAFLRHVINFGSCFTCWRPGVCSKVLGSMLWWLVCGMWGLPALLAQASQPWPPAGPEDKTQQPRWFFPDPTLPDCPS